MARARVVAVVATLCLLAACADDSGPTVPPNSASSSAASKADKSTSSARSTTADDGGDTANSSGKDCPEPAPPPADGLSARATSLSDTVQAAVYPLPDHEGHPWSQWGIGAFADGKFFSAVGDHCGRNGDSYIYEFDPSTSTLRLLADTRTVVGHQPGAWGYGKVHARMINGADGAIYVTTYWGSNTQLQFGSGYEGDALLRIDPSSGQVTNLGVPIAHHGVPSLAGSPDGKLLYGEAVDPLSGNRDEGLFFVYDVASRRVVFQTDKPPGVAGFRNILVDGSGKAWFSIGEREAAVYDPSSNRLEDEHKTIPGSFLRASTSAAPDGTVYGVTTDPDVFFKVTRDGELHEIGPARGYTASLAMSPDGSQLYYVPDAHGSSFKQGTPVIAVDTASGAERVVVKLNDLAKQQLDLRLGGSYDVVLDPAGSNLFIGLNAGSTSSKDQYGSIVLAIVKVR